jgi:hypothetical protein
MVQCNDNCRGRAETHKQETTMIKDTTQSFEIPNEMRTLAERNVEQAKLAFTDYLRAAREAASNFDRWAQASQVGAQNFSKKVIGFAQSNGLSAFDFAQKMVQAKDLGELIQIQRMFFEWQIQALSEQVKELGETAATSAIGNVRDIREISEAA